MPSTSARSSISATTGSDHLVDPVEVVLADVDQRDHRLVGEQEVAAQQCSLRRRRAHPGRSACRPPAARGRHRARRPRRPASGPAWPPCVAARCATPPPRGRPGPARARRPGGTRADRTTRARRCRRTPAAGRRRHRPRGCGRGTCCRVPRRCSRPRPVRRCRRTARWPARPCGSWTWRPAGRAGRRAPWRHRRSGRWWRTHRARRARRRRPGRCTATTCRSWAGRRIRTVPRAQARGQPARRSAGRQTWSPATPLRGDGDEQDQAGERHRDEASRRRPSRSWRISQPASAPSTTDDSRSIVT